MAHYFENDNKIISEEKEIKIKIKNKELKFITDNGIFSKKGLDFGTRTLLENLELEKMQGKVLDFGCGYGPIGTYLATNKNLIVHMIDINARALLLAKRNLELNHVSARVYESNIYSNIDDKFDYIISNPPIRVGKKILYEILLNAKKYLKINGELWIVVNKDQGAKSLINVLKQEYDLELRIKNKGFYVIKAINR